MLESMVENPVPTRAEVSDIANAIYDGTGATMLSAETSAGKHPVAAATMMDRIARRTDADVRKRRSTKEIHPGLSSPTAQVIADAACHIAQTADVVAMAVCTASGATAKLISTYRPSVPVFAFTASEVVARQLSIIYGVEAIMAPPCTTTDSMLIQMERILVSTGRVKAGDNVLLVAGQPVNTTGSTNLIHLRCAAQSD
jgi:pyruvate kinase